MSLFSSRSSFVVLQQDGSMNFAGEALLAEPLADDALPSASLPWCGPPRACERVAVMYWAEAVRSRYCRAADIQSPGVFEFDGCRRGLLGGRVAARVVDDDRATVAVVVLEDLADDLVCVYRRLPLASGKNVRRGSAE